MSASPRPSGAADSQDKPNYVIIGRITNLQDQPLERLGVRAFDKSLEPKDDLLGQADTDSEGKYAIPFIRKDTRPGPAEQKGPDVYIRAYEADALLAESKVTQNAKNRTTINLQVDYVRGEPRVKGSLIGNIVFEQGFPAERLRLRLYRQSFGSSTNLVSETTSGDGGHYSLPYNLTGPAVILEIRAVGGEGKETPLSGPIDSRSISSTTEINLIVPAALHPIASEYSRLSGDLAHQVGTLSKLAEAKEGAEQQDITVLNHATGWDARLIALTATTERLAAESEMKISREALYGLLRTGLPSDRMMLAQVSPEEVERALKKARDGGIVDLTDQQIQQSTQQFTEFSSKARLALSAPGSHSTYDDLLKASGLTEEAQKKFAPVYFTHRGDPPKLWEKARQAGLDAAQVGKLQLQGKLSFLAGNSAAMTGRLMQKTVNDPLQLVDQDFHLADTWINEIHETAGTPANRRLNLTDEDRKRLETVVPQAYSGDRIEDRLKAYAEDMARKVRLSYPTHVVGRMIEQDKTDSFKLGTTNKATAKLLKSAAGQGFRLGQTPAAKFLNTHVGVRTGMPDSEFLSAQEQLKTLQRVYQITPSNEAMPVLMSMGIKSAYDLMAYDKAMFTQLYVAKYLELYGRSPMLAEPELVYRKATQVSSVTYNLFAAAKKLDSQPQVLGMSASAEARQNIRNELIKQFPTMESLFGSMDFCECEHCQSILSPAAYLVDLLQFIDPEHNEWDGFLTKWKLEHNQDYESKYAKPYDALVERRPDLPTIQLTCDNTNTTLPYIDIVNEILEYYVSHGRLEAEAAQNTGTATPSDLMAEPQNVIRSAYDILRDAHYPLTLPFDLWLETVRQFCNYFETPLDRILEVFNPSNDLFNPRQSYDRASIFLESLGLSPAESAILTDPDPLKNDKWYDLYGYPTIRPKILNPTNKEPATVGVGNSEARKFDEGVACSYFRSSTNAMSGESNTILAIGIPNSDSAGQTRITFSNPWKVPPTAGDLLVCDVPATLRSAKTLSRRLGTTYKQILEIVQTGFVNPKLTSLGIIYKLGVSVRDTRTYLDFKALLQQDPAKLSTDDKELRLQVQAFADKLHSLSDTFGTPVEQLEAELRAIPYDTALVLADPDAGCNFDSTTLRYANGNPADGIAFLRINLLVRLWRKLGWTIDETDKAIQALTTKNNQYEVANLSKRPLLTTLVYLAHLKALDNKLKVGTQGRLRLTTIWSDLPSTGNNSLYQQLFLSRNVLKSDPVFDNPLGQYLKPGWIATVAKSRKYSAQAQNVKPEGKIDPALFASEPKVTLSYDEIEQVQSLSYDGILTDNEKTRLAALSPSPSLPPLLVAVQEKGQEFALLKGHLLTLQGTLALTANEIQAILQDAGQDIDTAELSIANISLLYRYGLMAKALKLSINDLISLKQLSGLNPFHSLAADLLTKLEDDFPFTHTLRFVEIAQRVRESGLKVEDLDYLARHRFDEAGKYRPDLDDLLAFLKTLSDGIRAVQTQYAIPKDPTTLSDELLRQDLSLVLTPDVVDRFLAMMNGTVQFTAIKKGVAPADQLRKEGFSDETSIVAVKYDDLRQEQKLVYRGVLFDTEKNSLMSRLPKPVPPNAHVSSAILGKLLDDVQEQARTFFQKNLQRQPPAVRPSSGFLQPSDFDLLFDQSLPLGAGESDQDRIRKRRTILTGTFLPYLQTRLTRQLVTQAMIARTGADPILTESLLNDNSLLSISNKPLVEILSSTSELGITATFMAGDDGTGSVLARITLQDADSGLKGPDGKAVRPPTAESARFEGYLVVPTPGAYRFLVVLEKRDAQAEVRFDHLPNPVFLSGSAADDSAVLGEKPTEYLELKAGVLYHFSLNLRKLAGGQARLLVQGENLPKGGLSQLTCYPQASLENAEQAVVLVTKVLQVLQTLGINEHETRYIAGHSDDFDKIDLNSFPTTRTGDLPADAIAATLRFTGLMRLVAYTQLKHDLAIDSDDIIGIFEVNGTKDADRLSSKVYPLIASLTRRNEQIIKATANSITPSPNFDSEKPLLRLWEALKIVEQFGVSVSSFVEWSRIVSSATPPMQRFEIAKDLRDTIKAGLERDAWRQVAQSIFDNLRRHQRDSLVAYIAHQLRFARLEQLYEYFLIDPGMEPVVQTSRIRVAIAAVQLFIQRCLLNLELKVHPSVINSSQWEWMKRYRVWEANRKIFLFPENWLEPEFRDDKTHLYSELEGALLQGDVSTDLVEDSFLTYLKKLDELARLDIVAMHIEDNPDATSRALHVIGRTFNQPHKYFYRRYVGRIWTPWEPVTADIEGDHLAPVIWRKRLYLFWITFVPKPTEEANSDPSAGDPVLANLRLSAAQQALRSMAAKKKIEIHLHWSEYFNNKWSTRESSGESANDVITTEVESTFDPRTAFIYVSKENLTPSVDSQDTVEGGVYIHLVGRASGLSRASGVFGVFYLASRNSSPLPYAPYRHGYSNVQEGLRPKNPYTADKFDATRYLGYSPLSVEFNERITTQHGKTTASNHPLTILNKAEQEYTLLPCDNNIHLSAPESSSPDTQNPEAVKGTIESGLPDIAALAKPVFYQNRFHTFFVEPNVIEQTVEDWQEWVTRSLQPDFGWLKEVDMIPQIPRREINISPALKDLKIDQTSFIKPTAKSDWLVNPGTGLLYGNVIIGPAGRSGLEVVSPKTSNLANLGTSVNVSSGSHIGSGGTLVSTGPANLAASGLKQSSAGLNIVGGAGLNLALAQNARESNRESPNEPWRLALAARTPIKETRS